MRASSDGPVTAGDLLMLPELGHFRRTSTLRGVGLVLHAWGVIASSYAQVIRNVTIGLGTRSVR